MSKRKHRNRSDNKNDNNQNSNNSNNVNNNRGQFNNNPFGINPNQLLSMFGNIDMSQISNMLQSMNTQGFDLNNFNLGPLQDLMGSSPKVNERSGQSSKANEGMKSTNDGNISMERNDENIQMLRAIRSIVGEERAEFIDKIIQHYNDGTFDD